MRTAAVLLALVVPGVACSSGAATPDPPQAAPRDAVVEAMWAVEGDEVEVLPLDRPYLPATALPDGVVLTDLGRSDDGEHRDLPPDPLDDPTRGAQTLYADPEAPDPARGRSLVVGRTTATDVAEGIVAPGGEAADLHGVEGRIIRAGDLWVAAWPLPHTEECTACDQEGFVAGRGLDRDQVLAAARGAQVGGRRPALPVDLRPGLEPLGTVAGSGVHVPSWAPPPQHLTFRVGDAEVRLTVLRADPRLVAHLEVWASDGRFASLDTSLWRAEALGDGVVVQVGSSGTVDPPSEATVDGILAALRPADPDDVAAAQARLLASVPLAPCDIELGGAADPTQAHLFGTAGEARWVIGMSFARGTVSTCETIARVGTRPSSGGGGGPGALGDDPVEVVSRGVVGTGDGRSYRVTVGHVPDVVARVAVAVVDLEPVDAALADTGPVPGRRWFAAVVDVTPLGLRDGPVTVVAHAPDGAEVARVEG